MKLIILVILTATINVTLINKNNGVESPTIQLSAPVEHSFTQDEKPAILIKKDIIGKLKEKMLTHLKKYGKHIVNILVKTHIISIENSNSTQNISAKPRAGKAEKIQNI